MEDRVWYASTEEPGRRRERCIIGAVLSEYWHQRDASIYSCRKANPPNHHIEDSVVDVGQKNKETGKEEE
jgi:hypothetical protein